MNSEEIKEAVSGTGLAELSIGYGVIVLLRYKNISIEEFITYFEELQQKERGTIKSAEEARRRADPLRFTCKECGSQAMLTSITIPTGKGNLYGWRSVIRCTSCSYEEFSEVSVSKILRRMKNAGKTNFVRRRRKCHDNSI